MTTVATAAKSGFQTAIPLSETYSSIEVQALDSAGKTIGSSPVFTTGATARSGL